MSLVFEVGFILVKIWKRNGLKLSINNRCDCYEDDIL